MNPGGGAGASFAQKAAARPTKKGADSSEAVSGTPTRCARVRKVDSILPR